MDTPAQQNQNPQTVPPWKQPHIPVTQKDMTGLNPVNLEEYAYSSLSTYNNPPQRPWIETKTILQYFESSKNPATSYMEFVRMIDEDEPELSLLTIEDE